MSHDIMGLVELRDELEALYMATADRGVFRDVQILNRVITALEPDEIEPTAGQVTPPAYNGKSFNFGGWGGKIICQTSEDPVLVDVQFNNGAIGRNWPLASLTFTDSKATFGKGDWVVVGGDYSTVFAIVSLMWDEALGDVAKLSRTVSTPGGLTTRTHVVPIERLTVIRQEGKNVPT